MRITRLDLLRYGKFTDKSVSLPKAAKDFHLIVGPNEAGKSTLRNAILDLLFGIETRSRYNFLHPHSEMRLGAAIEQGDTALEFVRTKARTKTLQTTTGNVLADSVLTPYLGEVDRSFFDQMFGLNHERLVQGGQDILSASNDMGQILFQAAAGVGSLGQIRDKLEAEANSLWAKRKSGDREYYAAAAELEQAEATLKATTVRTKDWQEASTRVNQIGLDLQESRQRYKELEKARVRLERVRRTEPLLTSLKDLERALTSLGQIVALPEDAADQLANAERDIAIATQSAQFFGEQAAELTQKLSMLLPDDAVLVHSTDVDALFALRQELRSIDVDISKREGELQVVWQEMQESARQLGWPEEDEDALSKRLPITLVKSAMRHLTRRHDALFQALATSDETLSNRQQEVNNIDLQIETMPQADLPIQLFEALANARALGDLAVQEKQHENQVNRLQRDLVAAKLELGQWIMEPQALGELHVASLDEINALIKRRTDLETKVSAVEQRVGDLNAEVGTLQLEIAQYKAAHQPVTLADVLLVRKGRDVSWNAIKNGTVALQVAAVGYEHQVAESDSLSDQRHDRAQQATELQLKLDQLERLQRQLEEQMELQRQHSDAVLQFDQMWFEQIQALGLAGMPLLKVNSWRMARDKVLHAAAALTEAQLAQSSLTERSSLAALTLVDILKARHPEAGTLKLSGLILWADDWEKEVTRSQERRAALSEQKLTAQSSIKELMARQAAAQAAVTGWEQDFQSSLVQAHLPVSTHVEAAQDALDLFDRMQVQLQKIRDLRVNRIGAMRLALKDFDQQAKALASAIAPDLVLKSAADIAQALDQRLKDAQSVSQEVSRLKVQIAQAESNLADANGQIALGHAGLRPLLSLSITIDNDSLRVAIGNSDRSRSLTAQFDQTVKQLTAVSDGFTREVVESELSATDVSAVSIELADIQRQTADIVDKQNVLSGDLNAANTNLEKIAGQDDAARAESQRQEALARMVNAVDRFIKVHTAAKLLRWSIERFRESKQGPMLSRASEVFMGLTQGAFCKLAVDYESEPLKLSGQRVTGELVDIEGMSDGTRDQLYLALRLAALELHLQKTVALPFIADDLFINYDDGRASAGLHALGQLSESTQVIFLTHHQHLVPVAQAMLGERLNVVNLG